MAGNGDVSRVSPTDTVRPCPSGFCGEDAGQGTGRCRPSKRRGVVGQRRSPPSDLLRLSEPPPNPARRSRRPGYAGPKNAGCIPPPTHTPPLRSTTLQGSTYSTRHWGHALTDPIIERLADHSDMLATLTEIIDKLTRRVEHLEQLEADDIAAWHEHLGTTRHD